LGRCKQKQRGLRGYYVAGPPLLNERCTSLLSLSPPPIFEMTYTVSSGTLNYYTILVCFYSVIEVKLLPTVDLKLSSRCKF